MPKTKHIIPEFVLNLDRLPGRGRAGQAIERAISSVIDFYGFEDIAPSLIDDPHAYSGLLKGGFLDDWPPVFAKTRSGDDIMLRPSGALAVIRAYAGHRMQDLPHPLKFSMRGEHFFLAPGPIRSAPSLSGTKDLQIRGHEQWCLAMIGEESAVAEAEIIQIFWRILQNLPVEHRGEVELRVNAVGCSVCRGAYRSALGNYLRARKARLCLKSRRDLKKNPARIFSCTEEKCRIVARGAPQTLDFLCDSCKHHIRDMLEFLDEIKVPYFLDSRFFGNEAWLNTVVFEFSVRASPRDQPGVSPAPVSEAPEESGDHGALPARAEEAILPGRHSYRIAQGGRMSLAAGLIAGKETHAVAGTLFLPALEKFLSASGGAAGGADDEGIFLVQLGDLAKRKSFSLLEALRSGGIAVKESLGRDSIKVQLKIAENSGVRFALIIGQKEALDKTAIVREVDSGIQETVPQEKLIEFLKKKLKK